MTSRNFIHLFLFLAIFTQPAMAKHLTLLTEDGPPHMIQSSNSGIDIDITVAVLQQMGHTVEVSYAPLSRAKREVIKGNFDLTVPTFYAQDQNNFYLSKPMIPYKPTVFTNKPYKLTSLNDIKDLQVITFQGATGYFGDEFEKMADNNNYIEISNMENLPMLLFKNRTDAVVLDYYIFHYFASQQNIRFSADSLFEYSLIPEVKASVGFHDQKLRDEFNRAYDEFYAQKAIQPILNRYLGNKEH